MNASHFSPLFFVLHLTLSLTFISCGHDSPVDLTNLKKKQNEQKIRLSFKKKKSQLHQHQGNLKLGIHELHCNFIWNCQQSHFITKGFPMSGDTLHKKWLLKPCLVVNWNTLLLLWPLHCYITHILTLED